MADKPAKTDAEKASASTGEQPAEPQAARGWRRLLLKRWMPFLLVFTLLVHGLLLCFWRASAGVSHALPSEISLGKYHFVNAEKNAGLGEAQFAVHVSLLLGTERSGGQRLEERKFLVQQGVEELLRQAHAADFDDPTLAELKRQIQEKINEALELRTVESVIITDLQFAGHREHHPAEQVPSALGSLIPAAGEAEPQALAGEHKGH